MLAVQVKEFGGPEVLAAVEVADPVAGAGEVVVRVEAADVIHVETIIRYGLAVDHFPMRPPYVPGGAVVGIVESVGAGVPADRVGERVAARMEQGGYAERALVPEASLIPVPGRLAATDAAALLHDGPTALGLFEATRAAARERVLITAAAGGMGLLLVQLAVAAGVRVVGAARGERKLELLRSLGAEAVDYTADDWTERAVEALSGRPDLVLDGAGGPIGRVAFGIVADGGRFSAHGAPAGGFAEIDPAEAARRGIVVSGVEQVQFSPERARELAARAFAAAADGALQPFIGQAFPLADAPAAHLALETRNAVGKTLLIP